MACGGHGGCDAHADADTTEDALSEDELIVFSTQTRHHHSEDVDDRSRPKDLDDSINQ